MGATAQQSGGVRPVIDTIIVLREIADSCWFCTLHSAICNLPSPYH
jgi:hypothetical protein